MSPPGSAAARSAAGGKAARARLGHVGARFAALLDNLNNRAIFAIVKLATAGGVGDGLAPKRR